MVCFFCITAGGGVSMCNSLNPLAWKFPQNTEKKRKGYKIPEDTLKKRQGAKNKYAHAWLTEASWSNNVSG